MKFVLAFVVLVAAVIARPEDNDFSKYENFNVDEITGNSRLLKAYTLCFLGEDKCTPEGKDFSKWIPDGVKTSCGKCSKNQKHLVTKFIQAIKEQFPELYERLVKHIDPEGQYQDKLNEFLIANAK